MERHDAFRVTRNFGQYDVNNIIKYKSYFALFHTKKNKKVLNENSL